MAFKLLLSRFVSERCNWGRTLNKATLFINRILITGGPMRLLQKLLRGFWNHGAYKLSPPAHFIRRILGILTRVAPLSTLTIILLLIHFTYQLLPATVFSTFLLIFFVVELFGNWILFYITKSYIEKSSGNSEICAGLSHTECRQLRYCPDCEIFKPERSHHCTVCNRCIHQRDHHCFFLGTCVGGYNLCYFVLFCFYACLGCFYSANKMHEYYSNTYLRDFWSAEFHYYFYPVTLLHWFNGKAALVEVGWVTLLYVAVATVIFTGFSVTQQLIYVFKGQTAYEYNKGLLMVHRSAAHNFLHVFGRYWMLHWLLPLPRCDKQPSSTTNILKII